MNNTNVQQIQSLDSYILPKLALTRKPVTLNSTSLNSLQLDLTYCSNSTWGKKEKEYKDTDTWTNKDIFGYLSHCTLKRHIWFEFKCDSTVNRTPVYLSSYNFFLFQNFVG